MSIVIDGTTFNVPVTEIGLSADFLDKMAERDNAGLLHRELLGVYFNQSLKFGLGNEDGALGLLFEKLTEPVEFHTVTVKTPMGAFTFKAYCSNIKVNMIKDKITDTWWSGLTVNFTAQKPTRS